MLGVAGRHRRFDQLSFRRFAVWGAIGGLLLSFLPAALVITGLATISESGAALWAFTAAIAAPLVILSTLSASGSLLLARKASRETPALNSGFDEPQLTAHDT